jgi:hypothetical protein
MRDRYASPVAGWSFSFERMQEDRRDGTEQGNPHGESPVSGQAAVLRSARYSALTVL